MLRAMDRWLPGYVASLWRRPRLSGGPRHLLVCIADHFEPFDCTILPDGTVTGGVATEAARESIDSWCRDYRVTLGAFRDSDGQPPRHTFFYPWDEYEGGCLDRLATFCREGYGEVEIHLHHRNDTEEGVREKLTACRDTYSNLHGLLGRRAEVGGRRSEVGSERSRGGMYGADSAKAEGQPVYAFVHGNWCLCNARPDGDWCGVDRELAILAETGCYADLTFPSAPDSTQPRCVNTIYYGRDPREGERGPQVAWHAGHARGGEGLSNGVLMIPGPLGVNWNLRKWGIVPRLENGEISGANPATAERLSLWQQIGVSVPGQPDWTVIKLHTHSAAPANRAAVLGPAMAEFHAALANLASGSHAWKLHYVTARELFNIIKAAECGSGGNPGAYRNAPIGSPFATSESSVDGT